MADVFLSYSREDQSIARRFAEALERTGFSVWWDQSLSPGEAFDQVTEQALEAAGAVVVLWSPASVGSRWVRAEATQASANGRLLPVTIEPCKRPIMFELIQTLDLSGWNGNAEDAAWQALVAGVRRLLHRDAGHAADAPRIADRARTRRRIPALAAALALVLVLAAGAGLLLWQGHGAPATQAVPSGPIPLAVLPFANLSADPAQEYFSDGLTEELLNQLAQVRKLRVIGRTSSFAFKGRNEDLRTIGRTLGVDYLLEGSVRKEGQQVRINAQLIDAHDGTRRWSKPYEHSLSGVFALQEQIARDVTHALSIVLDVSDMPRAEGGTTDVEAYDLYLRGVDLSRRNNGNDFAAALQLLRDALKRDPDFTSASLLLASYLPVLASGMHADTAAALLEERDAIMARLARAESMPQSPALASRVRTERALFERRWADAIAASASDDVDKLRRAVILDFVGRFRDATVELQRVVENDPLLAINSQFLRINLSLSGRAEELRVEGDRAAKLGLAPPESRTDWLVSHDAANRADLAALKKRQLAADGTLLWPFAGEPPATLDDVVAATAALQRTFDDPGSRNEERLTRIAFYADFLGARKLAVAALRRSVMDLHGGWPFAIWSNPRLRREPEFKALLRDLGLVDYWRSSGRWADFCRPVGADDFECR